MGGLSLPHLIVLFFVLAILVIPTVIAFKRDHSNKWLVLLLTFVPVVGWIAALVWAIVGKSTRDTIPTGGTFD